METAIREMTEQDRDGKAYVHWQSWRETYPGLIGQEFLDKLTYAKCREITVRFPENTFVADTNGTVSGFATFGLYRDQNGGHPYPDAGEIYAFYVLRRFQRRGVGSLLMSVCMERFRLWGCRDIFLWVLEGNEPAIRFYTASGFIPDGGRQELVFSPDRRNAQLRMRYGRLRD